MRKPQEFFETEEAIESGVAFVVVLIGCSLIGAIWYYYLFQDCIAVGHKLLYCIFNP